MYKVLIIDDEPWARKVVKKIGKWDELELMIIDEANDGIEGLEKIKELKPHIVITDMRMPGIDGVALLRNIYEILEDVMIIAMSGYNDFIYLKQAIKSNAVDYLLKPINPDELNNALRKSIERLNQKRKESMSGFGTLHLFDEESVMRVYLDSRQLLHESLIGLKEDQVGKELERLENFLLEHIKLPSLEIITKIGHDLIQMLQENLAKDEGDRYENWKETYMMTLSAVNEVRDFGSMFKLVSELYINTIKTIIVSNKDKKQLDTKEIHEYIEHHFCDNISLESIADQFFVTKEHLSRTYKAHYDMTINEQLIRYRMEKAKILIHDQKLAIKDVASIVGYNDLAYFYRVFKKHVGMTPGDYRTDNNINNVQ